MVLKIRINGQNKNITRHRMVTFVGGTKKKIPKGITFINGEKKVLWQVGELVFNSWLVNTLAFPYTTNANSRIYGIEANEDKVLFNIGRYLSRSNVSNISNPYNENTVEQGGITYHREEDTAGTSSFDSNLSLPEGTKKRNLTCNQIDVSQTDLSVTVTSIESSSFTSTVNQTVGDGFYTGMIYAGSTYEMCRIVSESGQYKIYKNFKLSGSGISGTVVTTISSNGYSSSSKPLLYPFAIYNDRYLLMGAEYQATSGGNFVYSLKKVDLSNGAVTNLLNNKTTPITGIMVEGSNLIVSVENKLIKMDMSGTEIDSYSSSNTMPTLIGKYGDYYYMTTTRAQNNRNYMNIELVDINDFSTHETKETDIKMVETFSLPYKSGNGFICFATKHYIASTVTGGYTGSTARTASIRSFAGAATYSEVELRICRLQCY